jgi:hypothetical protein
MSKKAITNMDAVRKVAKAAGAKMNTPLEAAVEEVTRVYELLCTKTGYAGRTRQMIKRKGAKAAVESLVLRRDASEGYYRLCEVGLPDLTFEAVVMQMPSEFSQEALAAANARREQSA